MVGTVVTDGSNQISPLDLGTLRNPTSALKLDQVLLESMSAPPGIHKELNLSLNPEYFRSSFVTRNEKFIECSLYMYKKMGLLAKNLKELSIATPFLNAKLLCDFLRLAVNPKVGIRFNKQHWLPLFPEGCEKYSYFERLNLQTVLA